MTVHFKHIFNLMLFLQKSFQTTLKILPISTQKIIGLYLFIVLEEK